MRTILAAAVLAAGLSGTALADGGMSVQLPNTSGLGRAEAEALLAQLAQVNVITSNCPAHAVTDGEWTLITGTGDRLAAQLGLDAATYDRNYYAPAFQLLDNPASCDRIGPQARPLIARLKSMGGGTTPLARSQ